MDTAAGTVPGDSGRQPPPFRVLAVAVATYLVWTAVTYLLEGRLRTLLRPDAVGDRLVYALVANVVVGTLLALWVARRFVAGGLLTREQLGFGAARRTLLAVLAGGVAGGGLFLAQDPPSTDPTVLTNAFAQVLTVSIAELVVCWALLGGTVEAWLRQRGVPGPVAAGLALVLSSVAFGLYHVAHSPPFDQPGTIAVLTVVGLGTGLFFFVGRSLYGALVFHNCMALFGVTRALAESGRLDAFRTVQVPLLATALVSLVVLVAAERLLVRSVEPQEKT
ncbi:type II CAAX prenyl endopeptidase Rce1 family protein [Haloarchaeobius litoreus]|uniref:Type II CAAX prenyl endopeptidase Rce1 family protein n=1 Tax=Haloarchaeobius litoreus TaxID=755306 RepID=A0ABD6DMU7_9EURY|nr:CPBP family glutamic-type intramembrane protease [Haloarchaeobius litoreus]